MEHFVTIVNGWKPLTIITKSFVLVVAAVVDPPLKTFICSLPPETSEDVITSYIWDIMVYIVFLIEAHGITKVLPEEIYPPLGIDIWVNIKWNHSEISTQTFMKNVREKNHF